MDLMPGIQKWQKGNRTSPPACSTVLFMQLVIRFALFLLLRWYCNLCFDRMHQKMEQTLRFGVPRSGNRSSLLPFTILNLWCGTPRIDNFLKTANFLISNAAQFSNAESIFGLLFHGPSMRFVFFFRAFSASRPLSPCSSASIPYVPSMARCLIRANAFSGDFSHGRDNVRKQMGR